MFDILSFSDRLDWFRDRSRGRQHLLLRFARGRKVLNFNPPWEWRQAYKHPTKLYRIQDNLWHFEWGRLFPFFHRPAVAVRSTAFGRALCVRWLCHRLGIGEHIYLVWNPNQTPVVQRLPKRFTVYYAYDQFDQFYTEKESWREETIANEAALARLSDLAFGVSEKITDSLREKGARTVYYAPNAVDFELFAEQREETEVPADVARIPKPRVCYVGGLCESTDYSIIRFLARELPNYSFVLIGQINATMSDRKKRDVEVLLQEPNVFHLGYRPHAQIPSYLRAMNAGIAAKDISSSAYYCSPLKVYEYLASGIPVVCAPIAEAAHMKDVVYIASTLQEWVESVQRALHEDCPELRRRRQEFAKQHSWDNRAKQVMEIIENVYKEWIEKTRG